MKDRVPNLTKKKLYFAVFRIRIHVFFGLPDPDPPVRGMDPDLDPALDPDPDPTVIMQKYYFVTLFDFLSLKNNVNVPSKSNKQKKLF